MAAPHRALAACQEWILGEVLGRIKPHEAAHGFVTGRSTLTNAKPHVGRDVVVNVDLENFFPTITYARVRGLLQALGYSPASSTILALLCTEAPRRTVTYSGQRYQVATGPRALPQGACTSPAFSNLIAAGLDARFAYANELAGLFSRDRDSARKVLFLWLSWWRDLLLIKEGAKDVIF